MDTLGLFLGQAGAIPLLTASEEIVLSRQVQSWLALLEAHPTGPYTKQQLRALRAGKRARDRMITANLRLVVAVAKKFPHPTEDAFLDNVQAGMLGLAKAVERFDAERGYKFSTYGYWWIRQSIGRSIADTGDTIRLPLHVRDQYRSIERAVTTLRLRGEPVTPFAISEITGIKPETVRSRIEIGKVKCVASLDAVVTGDESGSSLIELIAGPADSDEDNPYDDDHLVAQLHQAIDALPERQRSVVIGHDFEDWNFQQCGAALGKTRETARKEHRKAMESLRSQLTAS